MFVPPLGVKRFSLLVGALLIGGAAAAVIAIKAADKATAPALGPAGLLYDLNVVLNILLVAGLTFGYWLAKRGNIAGHRYNQTIWMLLNAVLVALIMVWGLADVTPKAASDLAKPHVRVPWVHAALGSATIACGLWLVLQMNGLLPQRLHVRGWKTLMRVTLAGYWLVAAARAGDLLPLVHVALKPDALHRFNVRRQPRRSLASAARRSSVPYRNTFGSQRPLNTRSAAQTFRVSRVCRELASHVIAGFVRPTYRRRAKTGRPR